MASYNITESAHQEDTKSASPAPLNWTIAFGALTFTRGLEESYNYLAELSPPPASPISPQLPPSHAALEGMQQDYEGPSAPIQPGLALGSSGTPSADHHSSPQNGVLASYPNSPPSSGPEYNPCGLSVTPVGIAQTVIPPPVPFWSPSGPSPYDLEYQRFFGYPPIPQPHPEYQQPFGFPSVPGAKTHTLLHQPCPLPAPPYPFAPDPPLPPDKIDEMIVLKARIEHLEIAMRRYGIVIDNLEAEREWLLMENMNLHHELAWWMFR
ncbi:hypothetical protein M501DRAFT_1058889 [Patellaria atrata CBS 101060]|uniref:Uncharacterized protein n=1 Tax=Patellaria atrata CBS 101060 TaxID=1346257 RepID=A0A9P4S989_9PEZI|nr:hypothetical protein M501DRAFT_1058889 [Patellaria atrata CBS 101060]